MATDAYLSSPSSVDTYASDAEKTMMDQFQSALDSCIVGWRHGDEAVLLQSDIQDLFGDTLMEYFKYCLAQQVGSSITFTTVNNGSTTRTFVQMPKNEQARLQLEARQTNPPKANDRAVVGPKTTSAVKRKAPRPMNCWIIFRDAMHKKLKAENPHLTVQQISTRCSQIWKDLSPAEKQPWQAAAKSAKEEHLRLHPEYKYNPRRPGEKKKRQSRKTKRAVAIATDPGLFSFQAFPDTTSLAHDPLTPQTITTNTSDEAPTNFGNIYNMNTAQLTELSNILSMGIEALPPLEDVHDAECLRHDRLEAEFGTDFETNMAFDLFNGDSFAFRDGADGNVTLPSFYSEMY